MRGRPVGSRCPRYRAPVQLVVVGSIGLDTIATPGERRRELLGGSVSYACAAASFFCKVGMVGVVGEDFPAAHVAAYRRMGIDLAGLSRERGRTFRWSGVYERDMINRRTLATELNVFERFDPVLPEGYRSAPFFLLGNISPQLQLRVLDQARAPRLVLADTMDLWIRTARDAVVELASRVHVLALNDGEARMLAGRHNLVECGERLLAMGPRCVVVKKGEHGALLFRRGGLSIVPAFPVRAVRDPTGAGDAFAGAAMGFLAGSRASSLPRVREALLRGAVVASFAVEDFSLGALAGLTRSGIAGRLRALRRMAVA